MEGNNMMISKTTFVKLIAMLMKNVDQKMELLKSNDNLPDECKNVLWKKLNFSKI